MVRTYKRTVRQKPYVKYTPNQIKLALEDLKNGLTFRACSKKHNIPTTVLHRHNKFKNKYPSRKMKKQGGQSVLSYETEKMLAKQLILCST